MSNGLKSVGLLNTYSTNLDLRGADTAASWNLDEEQHEAFIEAMNVADEVQLVVCEGGVFSRTIYSFGTCGLLTS